MQPNSPPFKTFVWCLLIVVASVAIPHPAQANDAEQYRALWVVRNDMTSQSHIDYLMTYSEILGINTLIVQVTSSGSTIITSELYPRSDRVATDFDPLAYIIERARELNIEVHAWINTFVLNSFRSRPQHPDHIVNKRPELITYDAYGNSLVDSIGLLADRIPADLPGVMLEPTLPEVRRLVADHAAEIVSQYDVDGIHLDYVRYAGRNYGYHPETRARFAAQYGYDPLYFAPPQASNFRADHGVNVFTEMEQAWDDFRRQAVTDTVKAVYEATTSIKPWVRVSVAAFANADDAYRHRFQDWLHWLRDGVIDMAVPMAYSDNPNTVRSQLEKAMQAASVSDRYVIAGLGSYNIRDDRDTMETMLHHAEELATDGIALFSYQSIIGHAKTFLMLRDIFDTMPAPKLPDMAWKPQRPENSE